MTDLRKAAEMALEFVSWFASHDHSVRPKHKAPEIAEALRQALAQPEQEPVGYINGMYGGYMVFTPINPSAVYLNGTALYTAPVDAVNMSQERVDETAKREHEWKGLDGEIPGLGLVTEEFYNGMLFAEDVLREKNT